MELQENLAEFKALEVEVVAVSVDPLDVSRGLSEDLGLQFAVAADTERRLTKALGIYDRPNDIAWPAVYIVGADGKIEWRDVPASYVLEKRPTATQLLDTVKRLRSRPPPAHLEP